jgi:hypothetical protein
MKWMESSAVFSQCGSYRYMLGRTWDKNRRSVLFVGLNPSTADATADDPTIRRCVRFARDWGYGSLLMANLFAYRCTEPTLLRETKNPIGPRNNWWLEKLKKQADLIVVAWGVHGALRERNEEVLRVLPDVRCLGVTKAGHPRHPLYLPAAVRPRIFQSLKRREGGMFTH